MGENAEKISLPRTAESPRLERIRHTCSHVMAMAVQKLFPGTQVTIGPATDYGFYYDFDSPHHFTPEDLQAIKREMQNIIKRGLPVIREEISREEAKARIEALGER
ncbi:MAG: hypothetical protein Q6L58_11820, partial [Thermostichales cyanobacterium BF3_bins_165]